MSPAPQLVRRHLDERSAGHNADERLYTPLERVDAHAQRRSGLLARVEDPLHWRDRPLRSGTATHRNLLIDAADELDRANI